MPVKMHHCLEYRLVKEFQVLFITLFSENQIIFWLINFQFREKTKISELHFLTHIGDF